MEYTRETFIEDLIKELKNAEKNDSKNFILESYKTLSVSDVFEKLCFDYPTIKLPDIRSFTEHLQKLISHLNHPNERRTNEEVDLSSKFYLHPTFVNNLTEWSGETNVQTSEEYAKLQEQKAALSATVFLKLPDALVKSRIQFVDLTFRGQRNDNEISYDWFHCINDLHSFTLKMNASIFSSLPVDILVQGRHLSDMISFITILTPLFVHQDSCNGHCVIDETILFEMIQENQKCNNLETFLKTLHSKLITQSKVNTNESILQTSTVLLKVKEMWFHAIYTCRDVFIQYPDLITTYLPLLWDSVHTTTSILTYPSSSELTILSVITSICSHLSGDQQYRSDLSSKSKTSLDLRAPRKVMKNFFKSNGYKPLEKLKDICNRFKIQPQSLVLNESGSMKITPNYIESTHAILDIAQLYLPTTTHPVFDTNTTDCASEFLDTQLFPIILNATMDLLKYNINESETSTSIRKDPNLDCHSLLIRLLDTILDVSVYNASLAAYTLKFPSFLRAIITLPSFDPATSIPNQTSQENIEISIRLMMLSNAWLLTTMDSIEHPSPEAEEPWIVPSYYVSLTSFMSSSVVLTPLQAFLHLCCRLSHIVERVLDLVLQKFQRLINNQDKNEESNPSRFMMQLCQMMERLLSNAPGLVVFQLSGTLKYQMINRLYQEYRSNQQFLHIKMERSLIVNEVWKQWSGDMFKIVNNLLTNQSSDKELKGLDIDHEELMEKKKDHVQHLMKCKKLLKTFHLSSEDSCNNNKTD